MPMNDGIDQPKPDEKVLVAGRDYINVKEKINNPSDTAQNYYDSDMNNILARKELPGNTSPFLKFNTCKLVICFVASVLFQLRIFHKF